MESHFRYEERRLLTVLETLALDATPKPCWAPYNAPMTETTGPSFRVRPGGLYLKASWALVVIGVLEAITGLAQLALRATTQTRTASCSP